MKRCSKGPEPASLTAYRAAKPNATWDEMCDDPFGGKQAYADVKRELVRSQRCLCAFCEMYIADGLADEELDRRKSDQRVEHFHPKGDKTGPRNWALHWPNLWAVCTGGDKRPPRGEPTDPRRYLPPHPDNLTCDAFKNYQIQNGKLSAKPEGSVLAPDEVPAFPRLFQYTPDGSMEPDPAGCATHKVPGNQYTDTATLVAKTIEHLNLSCYRLRENRRVARSQIEKRIADLRRSRPGAPVNDVLTHLARQFMPTDPNKRWAEFFTLVRWRLRDIAEDRLREMGFSG